MTDKTEQLELEPIHILKARLAAEAMRVLNRFEQMISTIKTCFEPNDLKETQKTIERLESEILDINRESQDIIA